MDRIVVNTPQGSIPLVGRLHADRRSPALIVIGGAFPPKNFLHELVDELGPDVGEIVVGSLPGMQSPVLIKNDFAVFAKAFDAVVQRLFPGRDVVVFGVSTGSLIAMKMASAEIYGKVLLEPFLSTRKIWPLHDVIFKELERQPTNRIVHDYLFELFGVASNRLEDRRYEDFVTELRVKTHVLFGDIPLMPRRPTDGFPSLTDEEDRRHLAANPLVRLHEPVVGVGHDIPSSPDGRRQMLEVVRGLLRDAARSSAARATA